MSADSELTYCNARLKGRSDDLPEAEPSGEWAGEGYCQRQTRQRRCKDHGGNGGRPVSHGLRSRLRDDLREFVEAAANQDNPGALDGELAVLRGLLFNFLEDVEALDKDSIEAAHKLLSEIRRTSDTIHKQMTRERLTKDEEQKLFAKVGEILRTYVPESDRDEALDELEQSLGAGSGRPALESGQ